MAGTTKTAGHSFRDRIVGLERHPASALRGHDGNWRTHPQFQQDALAGVLREVGIAGALLVYRSPAHEGALTIIDGHLRQALDRDQLWPCLVLDVDDDEARYLLATYDPLTGLAETGKDALAHLMAQVQSGEAEVQAMLARVAEDRGILATVEPSAPEVFPEYGEDISTDYCCSKCGYEWSGKQV
jgi:hypothetical protein